MMQVRETPLSACQLAGCEVIFFVYALRRRSVDSFSFFNAGKSTIIFALLRVQIANMSSFITTIQSKLGYSSKKALLLGAGFVTRPTVQILADAGVEVTVGQSH